MNSACEDAYHFKIYCIIDAREVDTPPWEFIFIICVYCTYCTHDDCQRSNIEYVNDSMPILTLNIRKLDQNRDDIPLEASRAIKSTYLIIALRNILV